MVRPQLCCHKDDVLAMGLMGLLFLSAESKMLFGPTTQERKQIQHNAGPLEDVTKIVLSNDRV